MRTNETNKMTVTDEFDRSICMSFFGNYRTSVKRIENKYGKEMAYDVQSAIIDYGLYGIRPTDEDLLIFISETVFDVIDKSQANRAKGFSGEDLEMSKKIIQSHRDRPELSQEKLAKLLHTSKGKVNKTLKKYRNGEYNNILDFSSGINDSDIDYDNDSDSTDRDRDRQTGQSLDASLLTEVALPTIASDEATTETIEIDFGCKLKSLSNGSIQFALDKKIEELQGHKTYESIVDVLVKEFTGAFYQCDREAIITYASSKLIA